MQNTGSLSWVEKTSKKGKAFYQVSVGGQFVGNMFDQSVLFGFAQGDTVTVSSSKNGNFMNVEKIEFATNGAPPSLDKPSNTTTIPVSSSSSTSNGSFSPHPVVMRRQSSEDAISFMRGLFEKKKSLSKTSLQSLLQIHFGVAEHLYEYYMNGVFAKLEDVEVETHEE